jgi:hypothetical protein
MEMKSYGWMAVALLLLAWSGCATPPARVPAKARPLYTATDWVAQGSGAFEIAGLRVFCGVGRASGAANAILLRAAADNRAKDELARVLNGYMAFITDAYLAQHRAAEGAAAQGQMLKDAAAALVESSLSKAVIMDHRQINGSVASLCRLELPAFKALIVDDARLENRFRTFCKAQVEALHAGYSKSKRS